MKKGCMLLSLKKTQFNGSDGRSVQCGKVQLGIITDNGFEPADYYVGLETYGKISNLQVGMEYDAFFEVDFVRKKIKLIDVTPVN